jgi:Glycosyl hydrolases family 39
MNEQPLYGQQPASQAKQPFRKSPQQLESQCTFGRNSRFASRKVHIPSVIGLFIVCMLLLIISATFYRGISSANAVAPSNGVAITSHASSSAAITVDFSSRQNHAHPIGNAFLGVNGYDKIKYNNQLISELGTTHVKLVRVSVDIPGTFPTAASVNPSQQNWADFDRSMTVIQAQGLQPILTLEFSPSWLEPKTNSCPGLDPTHVYPTLIQNGTDVGTKEWGIVAAQVVAHMDAKFPAVHPYYELWNEPDGVTFLCVPASDPNATQTRITEYKSIYAAAAPLMKQQAQNDRTVIKVGGPALAVPRLHASIWLPALVNDPTTAPYIDFISYHNYFRIWHADIWSNSLALMQNSTAGVAALFENVSSLVQKGLQPNAQSTPIFVDEYNTTTSLTDCCRNNPIFAPLWNAVFITDLLNSVNDSSSPNGAARTLPAGVAYFSVTPQSPTTNQFCLFGVWNSAMNCAQSGSLQPYPQYYMYQLLGDSRFLDITNSGFVANAPSVSTAGLVISGFYTGTKDNVLIVNTSGTTYSNLTVSLQNPGLAHPTASVYTLDQSNPHIGTSSITLSAGTGGYTATINIPAYSTVALSLA